MPLFDGFPCRRRYNSLRLLGYDYNSPFQLCAITLVSDLRRPLFADIDLAKSVLSSLLSDQTLRHMRVRAFTLMPDHLHFLAGVRDPDLYLPDLIGQFKSYTTQLYWKRAREILSSQDVSRPPSTAIKSDARETRTILSAVMDWRATLRPEVVVLKNWPRVSPSQFRRKRLWQENFHDHIIRNEEDLHENLHYMAMNPVKEGYVTRPQFYPFTGFLE